MSQAPVAPPWAPAPPEPAADPATLPTEPLAIAALVVASSTFFVLPFVGAVVALAIARRARAAMRAANGTKTGRGLLAGATAVAWVNIAVASLVAVALAAAAVFAPAGRRVDFASLQVGDCFNRATIGSNVVSVRVVSCSSAHQHEVVGVATHPAPPAFPVPGATAIRAIAGGLCAPALADYLRGVALPDGVRLGYVYPEEHRWDKGDRTVVCEVFDGSGHSRRRSVLDG
jgi:hypothetical protein